MTRRLGVSIPVCKREYVNHLSMRLLTPPKQRMKSSSRIMFGHSALNEISSAQEQTLPSCFLLLLIDLLLL